MSIASPTNWSAFPTLPPSALRSRLARRLRRSITHNDLIALYNLLIGGIEQDPATLALQAKALNGVFLARRMGTATLLFLELEARAWAAASNGSKAIMTLEKMPALVSTDQERADLLELTEDLWTQLSQPPFPEDAAPVILASLSRVFRALRDLERLAEVYLAAAGRFEDHGAFAPAYRALRDAEQVAREAESLPLLAQVLDAMARLTYRENDFETVLEIGEAAAALHRAMKQALPPWLMNTLATALMHLDRDAEAVETYEAAIASTTEPTVLGALWSNLAAARRKVGDLTGARKAVTSARVSLAPTAAIESRLELELVAARVEAQSGDVQAAVGALETAVALLADLLRPVLRLHRRRTLRDRYVVRFEMVLAELPAEGSVDAILGALAALRGTMSADWLSLLAWADRRRADDGVDRVDKETLTLTIERIKAVGAPFLYGYREKYDDPWEPVNLVQPWDDLSALLIRLRSLSDDDPYAAANPNSAASLLRGRLAEGYVILVPTVAYGRIRLWVLSGSAYRWVALNEEAVKDIFFQRKMFHQASISRDAFADSLSRSLTRLAPQITPVLDEALASGARGLLYFQEPLDQLPLFALAGCHDGVRAAMAAGTFDLRYTPILYPRAESDGLPATMALLSLADPRDTDLLLAAFEGGAAAGLMGAQPHRSIESSACDAFAREARTADVILVSTHGESIAGFVDPHFAALGRGDHAVNVQDLQRVMPTARAGLVILNACHSGDGMQGSLVGHRRTHDIASYPCLMLLNGKASVGAAGWRISDTAGFAFTCLAARFVAKGNAPATALGRAVATLRDLRKENLLIFLDSLPDEGVRQAARMRVSTAPEEGMFSHPYVSGSFQVVTLV